MEKKDFEKNVKGYIKPQKKILVIDVESTCWENKEEQNDKINEVIQIGASYLIGNSIQPLPEIFIKPNNKISKFCTSLTGITQSKIDSSGISPQEGYKKLKNLFSGITTWASYGYYDRNILISMLNNNKINDFISSIEHINVRKLFSEKILKNEDPKASPSNPKDSMEKIGLIFKGRNHDGSDDAKNIAMLLKVLLQK
jgi:inhibitor of KinA sporulation pathway (predicted exonuclease)